MVKIEFLEDFQCCWKKGDVGEVLDRFAHAMIEQGIAKAVKAPPKNKMVSGSPKNKEM